MRDDDGDYKKTYQEYWKALVETDGKLDLDKVMRELHDYHFMIEQVPKVYGHVSGGMISKPNTYAFEVINQHDDKRQEDIDWAVKEAVKETIERTLDEAAAHCEEVFRMRGQPKEHGDAMGRGVRDLGPELLKKAQA